MDETGKRGKELWNLLRNTVKISIDLIKKADAKSSVITHGIHHERKLNHDDELHSVIYNTVNEEIITVDSQFIRVFYKDGRRKDIVDPGESILTMVWSSKTNQYVAITSDHEMKLLNSDLEFISTANFQHKICCLTYNDSCNEVVSAGNGNVSSWCFRYGNKFLIPRKVITAGLSTQDEFNNLTLESTESKSQLCYATCGTGIAIFNLHEGKLISHKRDLHVRNITSILFFNPLKYIITGSRDGSIKLWNRNFDVQHVFVGHHGSVEAIALYPLGPYFLSASNDCTIRLWNFNTYDEVDLLTTEDPVKGICTTLDFGYIFSFSAYTVDLWSVAHIHQIFTTVGCDTFNMQMVSPNKKLPDRVICQCRDNTVRLISPTNGGVLTTLVPFWLVNGAEDTEDFSENIKLVDAAYCLPKENIFAAYDDGSLVKAWTATNPCKIQKVWKYEEGDCITCLCMYEYVVNSSELLASWEESKHTSKTVKKLGLKTTSYGNKVILLAGTKDGCIANIDMQNGKVIFKTDAHGVKGVIAILANVKNDQVITGGKDNIVKVWKMFPNTVEALSLVMSFYCALTPCHMTIADSRLAVAFQRPESATYSMVIYDLTTKERYDHSPDEDHTDDLTGLTSSARLKFFASSSKDGTIRIWNQENSLIRMLKLNAEPQSLEYCSQRGDLLVSLNGNIHHIQHESYLPKMYLFKMVCMEFLEQVNESPIGLDANLLRNLSEDTARCVKGAKSSHIKLDYTVDPMTEEELTMANESNRGKSEAFGLLSIRENELSGIRDGLVKPKRKLRRTTKKTESRAFQMYMRLFWRKPKKYNIDDIDFSVDPSREVAKTPEQWREEFKTGFFPPITSARPMEEILNACDEKPKYYTDSGPDFDPKTKYVTNPNGFIPNSILTRFLWSQDDVAKQKEELVWKPPKFSEEQMEASRRLQMSLYNDPPTLEFGLATPSENGTFEWEDEDKEWDDEDDEIIDPSAGPTKDETTTPSKQPSKKPLTKKPSALLEKMKSAMKTPPLKSPSPPDTPPPTKLTHETPAVSAQPKPTSVPKKPHKPIVKLVSKPPPPKPKTPVPPTPIPTPPSTPPPATPPPPNFITQFQGAPWFERYKDFIMQRLKRPYEASKFLLVVSDVMGIATDWDIRRSVVDAMMLLWQKEDAKDTRHLINAINLVINSSNPPSPKDAEQAQFLRSALKLYHILQGASDELIVELLTQYMEADTLHQNFIRNLLSEVGLKDRHNYLGNELLSWNVWNLDPTSPQKAQIKKMVRNWMQDWTSRFKNHLNQIMEKLKQGDLKANIRKTPGTPKGVLKYPSDSLPSTAKSDTPRVHFTIQATEQTLKNLTAIEVLNYFCEMMLENELERKRLSTSGKPEPTKNTVLVLPKLVEPQALVRLGEMHTAHRARVREQLAVEYKLNPLNRPYPDLVAGFTSKVILPVNIMHMNPFPSEIDQYERNNFYQPILLTLKSIHQKYFVPERSYVHLS